MSSISGVAGVLFDYGGTLTWFDRPDAALHRAYERIRASLVDAGAAPPPVEALLRDVHDRVEDEFARHRDTGSLEEIDLVAVARQAYADLGIVLDDAALDEFLRLEQEAWWEGVRLEPGAAPTLEALRGAGLRVGLCSNAPYRVRSMHAQLAHVGLDRHLDCLTFSAEVGWCKPDGRLFAAALAALGTTASTTVMVGDSEEADIVGALRAGMRAVLYAPRRRAAETPQTHANAVIRELEELPAVLDLVPRAYTGRAG